MPNTVSVLWRKEIVTLIAVVMAAPDYKVRFKDAATMLNYGFGRCSIYIDEKMQALPQVPVKKGKEKSVPLLYAEQFKYLSTDGNAISNVKRKLRIHRDVDAPVKKGEQAGEMIYSANGKELGRVKILYGKTVSKATYGDCLKEILQNL